MQRNKLLDIHFRADDPLRPEEERCSGRSTAIALRLLAYCLENPGVTRCIIDHHDTRIANQMLATTVQTIINRLNLKFLVIKHLPDGRITLNYDLWRDE